MKRTLLLAACFLIAGCLSETSEPEMPGVRVIDVRSTAKITAAWEAEAKAYEMSAAINEARGKEASHIRALATDSRTYAADAKEMSLEDALRKGLEVLDIINVHKRSVAFHRGQVTNSSNRARAANARTRAVKAGAQEAEQALIRNQAEETEQAAKEREALEARLQGVVDSQRTDAEQARTEAEQARTEAEQTRTEAKQVLKEAALAEQAGNKMTAKRLWDKGRMLDGQAKAEEERAHHAEERARRAEERARRSEERAEDGKARRAEERRRQDVRRAEMNTQEAEQARMNMQEAEQAANARALRVQAGVRFANDELATEEALLATWEDALKAWDEVIAEY